MSSTQMSPFAYRTGRCRSAVSQRAAVACIARYGPTGGGWVYTAGYVLFWWLVLLVLHRKKLFLRV